MTQERLNKIIHDIYEVGEVLILNENIDRLSDISDLMFKFVGIEHLKLSGNCFFGVNVKTDTDEELRPIPYAKKVKNTDYKPNPDDIDRTLPLLLSELKAKGEPHFPEISFKWSPNNGVTLSKDSDKRLNDKTKEIVIDFFKKQEQTDSNGKRKYNFVENVHDCALMLKSDEKCYVWISNTDFDARNNGDRLSCIMCISKSRKDIAKIKKRTRRFFEFIMIIKSIYVRKLDNQRILAALKAAKAAIMSRNMSHNIGSHVMSYLKQHLGSVKDIVADGILADLVQDGKTTKQAAINTEEITLPFLMGMGHFISYLQERQDFIATISTDYIPYFASVNFKDNIYDELNPDKRAERHTDRKNGKTDNILLGNIARSEGLGRNTQPTEVEQKYGRNCMHDIVLKFRSKFNGNPVDKIDPIYEQQIEELKNANTDNSNNSDIITIQDKAEKERSIAQEELEAMRKYDLSLPGGITGRQAVFSIMENIIRNAAKHGNWRSKGKLELTFDIFTNQKDDLNRIPDDDNIPGCRSLRQVLNDFYFTTDDADDLYFMTITDNCDFSPNALYKLQQGLMEDYIDRKTCTMLEGNKGLKEMRISAAWLRAIHDEEECLNPQAENAGDKKAPNDEEKARLACDGSWMCKDTKGKKAPLIYARICSPADEVGDHPEQHLQYIICLCIPRRVALVSSRFANLSEEEQAKLDKKQATLVRNKWRAYTLEQFIAERNKSFEFILVDDIGDKDIYNKVRPIATSRVFRMSDFESTNDSQKLDTFFSGLDDGFFSESGGCGNFMMALYKKLSDYDDKKNEKITIDDKRIINSISENIKTINSSTGGQVFDTYTDYVYRRHHDSDQFNNYMAAKSQRIFVESITGHNSSDRLVCHEELNDLWFHRHLHAMKQRVAIIDERLFSKITGREESSFTETDKEILSKDNSALINLQRNVHCFTLVKDPEGEHRFFLIGALFNNGAPQYEGDGFRCKFQRLAALTFSSGIGLKDEPLSNDSLSAIEHSFHFITIHQGLLDKLYSAFDIKDSDKDSEKKQLTEDFFNLFSRYSKGTETTNDKKSDNRFLPGMIIHSGRSKPSAKDMPQQLPFIQYAALEHGVLDCKYSLVELLDYARYES